ncbi:MAG TPA: hypothetical protein VE395_12115 [Acidimicrobiales bacterium]|nr:hypothetical protein [Acidimicrobiales bacterium]
MEAERVDVGEPSAGARAAAVVRGVGGGAADLTEILVHVGGTALARSVRGMAGVWGEVVGVAVDGVAAAVRLSTGRRRPTSSGAGDRCGARPSLDLIDLRTPAQIEEALATGLAAAAPPERARAAR